jgi:hypothetical protein
VLLSVPVVLSVAVFVESVDVVLVDAGMPDSIGATRSGVVFGVTSVAALSEPQALKPPISNRPAATAAADLTLFMPPCRVRSGRSTDPSSVRM